MTFTKQQNIERLILGTAQFGLNYGISNTRGQLPLQEIRSILSAAQQAGLTTLDTAAAYGESETCLGRALRGRHGGFRIISKYPPNHPQKSLRQALEESLEKLRVERLHGYLLHSYKSYSDNPGVLDELQELKASGKVERAGISLYHPHEAEELLERQAAIDIVQLPYSPFDVRFEEVMPRLRQAGIETHVRSVYLQGLYFLSPAALPAALQPAAPKVQRLQQIAAESGTPLASLLLNFALANPHVSNVVLGVESLETLQQNISYCGMGISEGLHRELYGLAETNENIILPYLWPKP